MSKRVTVSGVPETVAVSNHYVWPTLKHAVFLPPTGKAWGFKHIPFWVVILLGFRTLNVNGRFALETTHVTSIANSSALAGTVWASSTTRGLKCIQLSFQTLSTHSKPPRSPARQQALNVHFNTAPFQKDVDLLWFAQIYYECRALAQICADAFLGFLAT